MDAEIKKLADNRDLKSLKYLFVDSLDVDPTFVRYAEEYDYCKSIAGLLEPHQELTPFTQNKDCWNEGYWTNLKMDLLKNFSDERMMHMREVAKVFLAEKIQRILAERAAVEEETKNAKPDTAISKHSAAPSFPMSDVSLKPHFSKKEEQDRAMQRERERLERERIAQENKIRAQKAEREQQRKQGRYESQMRAYNAQTGTGSKKIGGIALAAIIVIILLAAIIAAVILILK